MIECSVMIYRHGKARRSVTKEAMMRAYSDSLSHQGVPVATGAMGTIPKRHDVMWKVQKC